MPGRGVRHLGLSLALLLVAACASGGAARSGGRSAGESGGDARLFAEPSSPVHGDGDDIVAWAQTEVPAGSRLQAAFAMADALARARLLEAVEVELVDRLSSQLGDDAQTILSQTMTHLRGRLAEGGKADHAWRAEGAILRVVSRLRVPKTALVEGLGESIPDPERLVSVLFAGSGDSIEGGAKAAASALSEDAPGWARRGESESAEGWTFVCEGEGSSQDEAAKAAVALCEDRICKLCGVEVESLVTTEETLDGVAMKREVVERCRRVRRSDTKVLRQSSDCFEGRCYSWVRVSYTKATRDTECRGYAEGNFASPEACAAAIEAFRTVPGYGAASYRTRVRHIDEALTACAEIDVRPTPLMESLGEKLHQGMHLAHLKRPPPRHLNRYWLKQDPAVWKAYRESPTFVGRLKLLREWLASKPPLLDVIEAADVLPEELDTDAGLGRLLAAMNAAPSAEKHGVEGVQFYAVNRLMDHSRRHLISDELAAVNDYMRRTFPPATAPGWDRVSPMIRLFEHDRQVEQAEWDWAKGSKWRARIYADLLDVEVHIPTARLERARAAIAMNLAEAKAREEPERLLRRVRKTLPYDGALFLAVESSLPSEVRGAVDWDFLREIWNRDRRNMTPALRSRFLARMTETLKVSAREEGRRQCGGLSKRLELLDENGVDARATAEFVCWCLEVGLAEEGMSLVNKSELYRRALGLELPCVRSR